jgi:hypothetical protein
MLSIIKDLNPKKYVDTDKKIELLEKKLEIQTDPDNAEWVAGRENVTKPEGQVE